MLTREEVSARATRSPRTSRDSPRHGSGRGRRARTRAREQPAGSPSSRRSRPGTTGALAQRPARPPSAPTHAPHSARTSSMSVLAPVVDGVENATVRRRHAGVHHDVLRGPRWAPAAIGAPIDQPQGLPNRKAGSDAQPDREERQRWERQSLRRTVIDHAAFTAAATRSIASSSARSTTLSVALTSR